MLSTIMSSRTYIMLVQCTTHALGTRRIQKDYARAIHESNSMHKKDLAERFCSWQNREPHKREY